MSDQPIVQLIRSPYLRGQTQFLGGAVGGKPGEEKIFCIPGHFPHVLVIDPKDDSTRIIGPKLPGQYKWLRGVHVPSVGGIIYGLPCHHSHVLRIDPILEEVTLIPLPDEIKDVPWKYHGGNLCPLDNCIYAIPQFAARVLKIDPQTDTVSLVGPVIEGKYKFYGGVIGSDGAIYGIPQNASSLLRIDPLCRSKANEIVTLHGDFGAGGHKWHGAAVVQHGDVVLGIPCHSNQVLKVEPNFPEPIITLEGDASVVKSGRHQPEHKYKFLGAVTDCDASAVYFIPSGAERVLRVKLIPNIRTQESNQPRYHADIQEVGTCLHNAVVWKDNDQLNLITRDTSLDMIGVNLRDEGLERLVQNKWQNGFTSTNDRTLYAIPLNGDKVLRIFPETDADCVTVETIGPAINGTAKWEGCVVAPNGIAYGMPNNYKGILKIIPGGVN